MSCTLAIAAFFLGAVPFGFIAGKLRGVDLREQGSGNIGATNTGRVLGKPVGSVVLLLDVAKGLVPVLIARHAGALPAAWIVGVGLAAILGHIYPPFIRFRGGKGVATSIGVLLGLSPLVALATIVAFGITVAATRYVSLGSLVGAITQAAMFLLVPPVPANQALPYQIFGALVAVFVFVRHRSNIQRLMHGDENRWGSGGKVGVMATDHDAADPPTGKNDAP